MRIRTGIFGGSFNPIHNGHIALAREIVARGLVDELWFLVSPQNPLKDGKDMAPEETRLQMAEAATGGYDAIKASDFEFRMPRPSYTSETLDCLSRTYPQRDFCLIIGQDNWEIFDRWHDSSHILETVDIIIYPRGDRKLEIDNERYPRAKVVSAPLLDISSTMIRRRVAQGETIEGLVPENVRTIIETHRLYI